jgi:hypothetical protein
MTHQQTQTSLTPEQLVTYWRERARQCREQCERINAADETYLTECAVLYEATADAIFVSMDREK